MIVFKFRHDGLSGLKKSEMNRIMRDAFKKVGLHWQAEMLPLHFSRDAKKKYKYLRRGGEGYPFMSKQWRKSYAGRKWREAKKQGELPRPLVWSGESEELSGTGRVISTYRRVRITIPAPTLNRRHHMRREITTVTKGEVAILERLWHKNIDKALVHKSKEKR